MLDRIRQQWPDLEIVQTGHTETAKVSDSSYMCTFVYVTVISGLV